jgi:hypothetical protein
MGAAGDPARAPIGGTGAVNGPVVEAVSTPGEPESPAIGALDAAGSPVSGIAVVKGELGDSDVSSCPAPGLNWLPPPAGAI